MTHCPLCRHPYTTVLYRHLDRVYHVSLFHVTAPLAIARCNACGIVFTTPQLTHSDLKEYYSEEYGSFQVCERAGFFTRLKTAIKKMILEQYMGYGTPRWWRWFLYPLRIPLIHFPSKTVQGKVLDIGCGSGNFLADLKELEWDVYGIDPSAIAVRVAQERGLTKVRRGYVESADFPKSFFDVVTLFHVFEHVVNPDAVLAGIKKILKPGGKLVIGVPNFKSFGSAVHGKYWAGLSFPLHYFHYNKETLVALLRRHGFSVAQIGYANMFSDICVSSLESRYNVLTHYHSSLVMQKVFAMSNRFFGALDYLVGNPFAQFFGRGSQITVISTNTK